MNNGIDEQVREILQNIPKLLIVAQEGIDSAVQQEYLKYTAELDFDRYSEGDISARSRNLFRPSTPLEEKKETLVILAHQGTVESYRTIERYWETAEQALETWSVVALQECRMFLESFLLDRDVGMVMTGLGGEGNMERIGVASLLLNKLDSSGEAGWLVGLALL